LHDVWLGNKRLNQKINLLNGVLKVYCEWAMGCLIDLTKLHIVIIPPLTIIPFNQHIFNYYHLLELCTIIFKINLFFVVVVVVVVVVVFIVIHRFILAVLRIIPSI
jgi:hypothetical protein